MSFSADIKKELSNIKILNNKKLVEAELYGYLLSSNIDYEKNKVKYSTENEFNINRLNKLLSSLNINYDISLKGANYIIEFNKKDLYDFSHNNYDSDEETQKTIIRGAFLGSGSINEPDNQYHLEIVFSSYDNLNIIKQLLDKFEIKNKFIERNKMYSLYIKDSEEISKFLALVGASYSVIQFEEKRVIKDTRNNINRIVNCETANLNKTINASLEQVNAIQYLKKINKFESLSKTLQEIAILRLENPELSLVELGKMLKQPIGKSGVNHRLKKIIEIANEYKAGE